MDILITQIFSLIEMYAIEHELPEGLPETRVLVLDKCKEKKTVGLPRRFVDAEQRIAFHRQRLKDIHYSTTYYHQNKKTVPCSRCGKSINSLAKSSHYKSKYCQSIVLTIP